ncbi:hypothetical protein F4604DRAFT_1881096 [Suillus subluteus]|nr:hypothetical protein F4604DRAFT_1881096 [Suillus subluteus]
MKGHLIVYPQNPSHLIDILPPPMEDVLTPICVLFMGSSPPTHEWLKRHAMPLIVHREKVRDALLWLKKNNRHYHQLQKILKRIFNKVVVMDVDPNTPAHELQAATMKHMKSKQGGFIQIPHGKWPVNEFSNPVLFPLMYLSLFPYGVGGLEDPSHKEKLSLKRCVKHLFAL